MKRSFLSIVAAAALFTAAAQDKKTFVVKANTPVAEVQSTMWGVFFEDINLGADGGIYAELIKNRSFEFARPLMGWKVDQRPYTEGAVTVQNRQGNNAANPRFLRVQLNNALQTSLSLTNEGFRGMGLKKDLRYDFSVMYRTTANNIKLHVELLNAKNEVIGNSVVNLAATGSSWSKATQSFQSKDTAQKGQCRVWFEGTGTVDMDMISLFP
ncbi:MAG: alpha-L-arabinofuranosidase, partial [Lacibacter sp.]